MNRIARSCSLAALVAAFAASSSAQVVPNGNPVVYGHHHVAASDVKAHVRFFADTLGGTPGTFGANNAPIVKFPGVLVFFRDQKPTGGSRGTTVNHIGFAVPNLRATLDKVKAAGFSIVTRTEAAANQEVKDDIAYTAAGGMLAFVLGPDDVKVELLEARAQTQPIVLHHVHFFGQQNAEMRAWYEKTFGAKPRQGGGFLVADLPGVALNFTQSPDATVGTTGRAIEHIGFEVKGLEAFTKNLEAQGVKLAVPYRHVPALNLSIAFVTDPWGTSIELTEGLDRVN